MTHQARALGLATSVLLLSFVGTVKAQSPSPSAVERQGANEEHGATGEPDAAEHEKREICEDARGAPARVVNGHRFIPFQVVTWPLVTTRFAAITSAGALWAQLRSNRTTTLVTLQENFQLGWAIARWMAIEGALLGSMAAATDVRDIISTGLSYAYGGRLAVVARLLERGPWYFSGRIDGQEQRYQSFVPERLIDGIRVSTGGVSINGSRIAETGRTWRIRPSLNLAVGVNRWFGLQVSGAVDIDLQNPERGSQQTYTTLDMALGTSFDFNQVRLPLSVMVGGRILHDFGGTPAFVGALQPGGRNRGQAELALYYSGRPGVDIGLSVRTDIGSRESSLVASPVINYVW
jgi:hypothetical protein